MTDATTGDLTAYTSQEAQVLMKLKVYSSGETQTLHLRNPSKLVIETETGGIVELDVDQDGRAHVFMHGHLEEQLDIEGVLR
jgi:hypothetical protein